MEELAAAQVENALVTKETNTEYREQEKALLDSSKSADAAEGSLAQLRLQLAENKKEWAQLSAEERENDAVGGELLKTIQAQDEEVKDLEKSIGVTSRNVGNYNEALENSLPLMGGFGSQISAIRGTLTQIQTAIASFTAAATANTAVVRGNTSANRQNAASQKGLRAALRSSTGALRAFTVALVSTGIGAIVVALGTLVAAFLSTQRGVDAVTAVMRPLQEIFQTFIGLLQNQAFKALDNFKKALDDPRQGLIDLADTLKNIFIKRFQGGINLIKGIGKTYINTFKLIGLGIKQAFADVPILGRAIDQDQLKKDLAATKKAVLDSAKETAQAAVQFGTGLDEQQQNSLLNTIAVAAERGKVLDQLQKDIERREIEINKQRAQAARTIEEQRDIAQDVSQSDAARLQAVKLANQAVQERLVLDKELIDLRIQLTKESQKANDTDREGQKELADLEAERIRLEASAQRESTRLSTVRFTIQKKQQTEALKAQKDLEKQREKEEKEEIKRQQAIVDNKAKLLQLERDLEAAQTEESAEQRFEAELELQDKLAALRIEKAKITGEETAIIEKENLVKREELLREERDRIAEENKVKEEEKQVLEDEKAAEREEFNQQLKQASIDAIDTASQVAFDNNKRRITQERDIAVAALQSRLDKDQISQAEFDEKRTEIDKKAFERNKRSDTARALINGSLAATRTFAQLGFTPAAAIAVGLGAIRTAAEIAAIQAQTFADGGYTGGGFGSPDSTGHRVAGVVHANEYVVPKRVLDNPVGAALVRRLEGMRKPTASVSTGFVNGGFTSPQQEMDMQAFQDAVAGAVIDAVPAIPVVNNATETEGVARNVNNIEIEASF